MTESQQSNPWPKLLLSLLGLFLGLLVWSALHAASLGSRVADSDYYRKGLQYNQDLVEKRAATVLGWRLATSLRGRSLSLQLTGRDGAAVARATGSLYLAIPGVAENIRLPLHEVAAGAYGVDLDPSLTGAIQARLELERDGARLYRQLLLNL